MKKRGWKAKLTKKELKHIAETTNGGLLREFKANRAKQRTWDTGVTFGAEPCWECRIIARKLGLET